MTANYIKFSTTFKEQDLNPKININKQRKWSNTTSGRNKGVIHSHKLKRPESLNYLGIILQSTGNTEADVNNRVMSTSLYYSLNSVCLNKGEVNKSTGLKINKTIFVPTVIYYREFWVLKKRLEKDNDCRNDNTKRD